MNELKLKPETIRVQLNMNRIDFVEALGINMQTYYKRLNGQTEWKVKEIDKLLHLSGLKYEQVDFS